MKQIHKPNFLIIGAAKCGTTSLAAILADHPECCMSRPKEVSFFQDNYDHKPNPNYEKGWKWYSEAFQHYSGEKVIGEATPSYTDRSRSPNTAKRIFEFNSKMKVIYMVRNPLKRQMSAWKMQYTSGKSNPRAIEHKWALKGFEYWMQKQKEIKQWDMCRYNYQLDAYRERLPGDQIFISFLEDWQDDQQLELEKICDFLKINAKLLNIRKKEGHNRADERTVPTALVKSKLAQSSKIFFPKKVRKYISSKYGKKKIHVPSHNLSDKTKTMFLEYIYDDVNCFLKLQNKPTDFWKM